MGEPQVAHHECYACDTPSEKLPSAHDEPNTPQTVGRIRQQKDGRDKTGNIAMQHDGLDYVTIRCMEKAINRADHICMWQMPPTNTLHVANCTHILVYSTAVFPIIVAASPAATLIIIYVKHKAY